MLVLTKKKKNLKTKQKQHHVVSDKVSSWTRRPSERGLDLLQSLSLGFRDEDHGEDDVDDANAGEEPEGAGAGQDDLEEVTAHSLSRTTVSNTSCL